MIIKKYMDYNGCKYCVEYDWDSKRVIVNEKECIKKEYDTRSKSIYAIIPDESESLMIVIQKRRCYIFVYNPQETLLNNGGKHIFVSLNNAQKIIVAIMIIAPISALVALYGKGENSYLYVLAISAFYCLSTLLYTTILRSPTIDQKNKRIWFIALFSIISIIAFLIALYCLYGM